MLKSSISFDNSEFRRNHLNKSEIKVRFYGPKWKLCFKNGFEDQVPVAAGPADQKLWPRNFSYINYFQAFIQNDDGGRRRRG